MREKAEEKIYVSRAYRAERICRSVRRRQHAFKYLTTITRRVSIAALFIVRRCALLIRSRFSLSLSLVFGIHSNKHVPRTLISTRSTGRDTITQRAAEHERATRLSAPSPPARAADVRRRTEAKDGDRLQPQVSHGIDKRLCHCYRLSRRRRLATRWINYASASLFRHELASPDAAVEASRPTAEQPVRSVHLPFK